MTKTVDELTAVLAVVAEAAGELRAAGVKRVRFAGVEVEFAAVERESVGGPGWLSDTMMSASPWGGDEPAEPADDDALEEAERVAAVKAADELSRLHTT